MTDQLLPPRFLAPRRHVGLWVLVLVGLLVAAALFWTARKAALDDFRSRFETNANARAARTAQEIRQSLSVLKATSRLEERVEPLSRDEDRVLSNPFLQTSPNLDRVVWIPKAGPDTNRDNTYRVLYDRSTYPGRDLIGSDIGSVPAIRSAMETARDEGVAVSAWWVPEQNGLARCALFLLVPTYRHGAPAATKEQRFTAFRGFVLGILRPDDVLGPFIDCRPQVDSLEILDLSAPGHGRVVYRHVAPHAGQGSMPGLNVLLPNYAPYEVKGFSPGGEWRVRITPGPAYMRQYFNLSYWLVLPGGLIVIISLVLLLGSLISKRDRMERIVRERTAKLIEHEERLEELVKERTKSLEWKTAFLEALINTSHDGVIVLDTERKTLFQNSRYGEIRQVPQHLLGEANEIARDEHLASSVGDQERFAATIAHLKDHPNEMIEDEIVLKSGAVLERYSSPVLGKDGTRFGRIWTYRDITERKRAEEALHTSRLQLSDAMDLARIVYWEADPATREFIFNDRFYALFATTAEREGGYRMAFKDYSKTFVHPDDLQMVLERSQVAMAKEGSLDLVQFEHRAIRRTGEVMYLVAQVRSIKDDGGQMVRIYGANQDITERKLAERAVRESENKFRDLAEKSIVGIYLVQGGKFKYVNARFAEIHGYAPEEMIDEKGIEDVVFAEDSRVVREGQKDNQSYRKPAGKFQLGFRIVTKQGDLRNVEIYGSHTTYLGRDAIVGTLVDVTERKRTEEALRWKTAFLEAQVNSSPDGILVIDNQGKTILQNQRTVDMWHIPSSIIGQKDGKRQLRHIVSMTKSPKKFRARIADLYSHPDETGRDEIDLTDGTVLDTYSCPVLGENGSHYGRIWTFRDITELRHYWDMLENLSTTDGLTDLPNRRRFDEFLNREWRRSMRDETVTSLILMDIDFFKEFNDHYGHLAGDDCLRQVAQALKEVIRRPGDLAARYGGEEFACILPDTDSMGAVALAHKIRERMARMSIPHYFSSVADHVTLSYGVASLAPGKGENPSHLIQLADDLLYSAKQGGRDQVKSWRQATRGRRVNAK